MSNHIEVNLKRVIEQIGEEGAKSLLSDYSCPLNAEIEEFLKEKAVDFYKKGIASTHLVYTHSGESQVLVGFYALAMKPVRIKGQRLSSTWRRRMERFSEYDVDTGSYWVALPLLGQLGKNYTNGYDQMISGKELLDIACSRIQMVQAEVSGKMAYLECKDKKKLVDFYEGNGFHQFERRETDDGVLIQLIKYF